MSRNLSNLYISESFQFLIQESGSYLQTGLGSNLTGSLLITASLADNATTASYATTAASATSASYATTASYALNASATVDTGSLMVTGSVTANTLTFTKGDGSTFNLTVNTGSAVTVDTGSLLTTASFSDAQITFTKGDGSTFNGVINNVTSSISASHAEFAVTASYATFASGAVDVNGIYTASVSDATITFEKGDTSTFDITVNNVTSSISSSYATTAATATSASYALTASYAENVTTPTLQTVTDAGNSTTNAISASGFFTAGDAVVLGTASIGFLNVTYESASVIYSSGSNQFGDASNDTQTLWGTVDILTGPLNVSGAATFHNGITGSLLGTASFADNATSASFADITNTATSASYATSASQAENAVSSSYALTASYAENAGASSPIINGDGVNTLIQNIYSASVVADSTGSVMIGGKDNVRLTSSQESTGFAYIGGISNTLWGGGFNVRAAAVIGGQSNYLAYGANSVMIGGQSNSMEQDNSVNIGGNNNAVVVNRSAIIAGNNHLNRSGRSAIIGGSYNQIYAYNRNYSFIGGGFQNNAYGVEASSIIAGQYNTLYDPAGDNGAIYNSIILGGSNNYLAGPAQSSGIIASSGSLLSGSAGPISGSVIIGGKSITGSANNTVYVPNLWITGSFEQPNNTIAIGSSITERGTSNNVQIGYSADVGSGVDYATVIGSGANGASSNDVAIGADASTGGGNSIAIGSNASATSLLSLAIGQAAQATDVGAVTIGLNSRAANDSVTVGGGGSTDSGQVQCVTLGNTTTSTAQGQVTIGREAVGGSGATNAVTIGKLATTNTNHSQSVIIGYNVTSSAAGEVNISDIFRYNPVTTTNNTVVTNLADTYGTPKINSVVTLTQAEYNAIGTPDDNTLYVISGSTPFTTSGFATTGSNNFTGQITGDVTALVPASNTASLDCSVGNFFTLTLGDGSNTRLEASNVTAGQTINLQVTNGGAGTGTISFGTGILQPTGSLYTGSAAANAIDVVSMISFDGATLLMNSVKQFV